MRKGSREEEVQGIYIYIYSRTVGRPSGSFDSLVSVLASKAPRSGGELFSEGLDFLDRGFQNQMSGLADRVQGILTIV